MSPEPRARTPGCRGRGSGLHLLQTALGRRLVVTPTQDLRAMADATAGGVVERDLHHQLRPERDPLQLLLALPAARIPVAAMAGLIGGPPLGARALLRCASRVPRPVVEAGEERADRPLLLARPISGDDGVDRADALDLDHALALARTVWGPEVLGDDALAAAQPVGGRRCVAR